jgi:hypothetical protein
MNRIVGNIYVSLIYQIFPLRTIVLLSTGSSGYLVINLFVMCINLAITVGILLVTLSTELEMRILSKSFSDFHPNFTISIGNSSVYKSYF